MRRQYFLAPIALIAGVVAAPASAQVAGIDAMKEWNLIVFGDLDSSSEVEGRTFVGGNLTGNSSNYAINRELPESPRGIPGLTVVGNVEGGKKNLNNGSGAWIGGNVIGGVELNGDQTVRVGGTVQNTNTGGDRKVVSSLNQSDPQFGVDLQQQKSLLVSSLTGLSNDLKSMIGTSRIELDHSRAKFIGVAGADGVAVFTLTADQLDAINQIEFVLDDTISSVIVNVSGTNIKLDDNFVGSADQLGNKVIWNFHEATSVTATTAFKGSVLAPLAAGQIGNFIEGSAVFASLRQNGEMHLGTFNADFVPPSSSTPTPGGSSGGGGTPAPVPEESLGLFALGALGLAALYARRRRKARKASEQPDA